MVNRVEQWYDEDRDIFYFWHGPLSNFYESQFTYRLNKDDRHLDVLVGCSEQAYMLEKAIYFKDLEIAKKLVEKPLVGNHAKSLGRKVSGFNNKEWDKVKYDIMIDVLYQKFKNDKFKDILLDTNDSILVEASPYDKVWGIGLSVETMKDNPYKVFEGENMLGRALMEVRNIIEMEDFNYDSLFDRRYSW